MIETREDSVNQYMGASRDLEKSYGICTPEVDPQSLRAPPAALPPRNSYSRGAESVTLQSQEHISTSQASRDPEKASLAHHMQSHQLQSHRTTIASTDEEDCDFGEDNDDPKRHAVWILIYLAALAPLLALPIAVYTICITIVLLLSSPFFLLLKQRPISTRFYRFIAPAPELQLGLIFSHHQTNSETRRCGDSIAILVLANTSAPFFALAVAVAAWVGGVFWFYTAILGSPNGEEERDDGREAVLAVRGWWESWLVQGLG